MKRLKLIFTLIFATSFATCISAQENNADEPVFSIVEEMSEYPGGEEAFSEFFANNVQYPKTAKEKEIQGKVFVTFVVSKDGSIKNAEVIRSVDPLIDKEALRVINAMPDWTPGKQRGEKVNVQYTLPINFVLEDEKQPQKN